MVIVEIGGEEGRGKKGSIGVGGCWPRTLYLTDAELKRSMLPKRGEHAGVLEGPSAGLVFQSTGDAWLEWDKRLAYTNMIVPLSLIARVTEVTRHSFILDKSAEVESEGANVYLDNSPSFEFLARPRSGRHEVIQLPRGELHFGRGVHINRRHGLILRGEGRDSTTIRFPRGVPLEGILISDCEDITLEDYKLEGNHAEHGFALDYAGQSNAIGRGYGQGHLLTRCTGARLRRILVQDVTQYAVSYRRSENCLTSDVQNVRTQADQRYIQWQFIDADSTAMIWEDVTTRNAFLTASFESFRSVGSVWRRCGGTNAAWSMNSSTQFLLNDCWQRIASMAWNKDVVSPIHRHTPLLNINSNIARSSGSGAPGTGGTIRDFSSIQEGPQDADGHVFKAIVINQGCNDIVVEGTSFDKGRVVAPYAPPKGSAADMYGPIILSTGDRTIVRGIRVQGFDPGHGGTVNPRWSPITLRDGKVENCVADKISAPTVEVVLTNDEYERHISRTRP